MGKLLELVDRLDAAIDRKDFGEVASFYADDAVFDNGTSHLKGRAAIVEHFRTALDGVTDVSTATVGSVEAGDVLAIETMTTATHIATGRRLEVPTMAMLRFRDGLVVEEHQYLDTGLVQSQLA